MSLSFPVFFIILAIGTGVTTGATALIGNALGRGDREEARNYVLQALSFTLLHALVLTVLGLIFLPSIFMAMGARGEYLSLALSYMNVIYIGSPFFLLNFVMNAILNAHGTTIPYRNFLVTGFFLNLVLDPWFMYGGLGVPAMGLSGIAMATIAIQCMGNFYLFSRLSRTGVMTTFKLGELRPHWRYYRALFGQGFPAAMNMMTVTLGFFIITWFVGRYGKEAVAAYGIGTRIEQIALLPVMGLNISTLTLTAQNYGAGRMDRVRQVLSISLRYGFVLSSIGTVGALTFTGELLRFFTSDAAVVVAGTQFLRVEALVFPAYVLLYVCTSAMQGIKRPAFALWVGLLRQIAGPFAVFHLLTTVLGWGIMGIWWGVFMVTWSAALIVVVSVTWILKRLKEDVPMV
jgi:putative MATE family efflux protein